MKLYVMRHGPAEDHSDDGTDASRALTPSGRERVRDVARKLAEENEAPKLIVSSPLVRAVQTAEIVHALTQPEGPLEITSAMSPRGDALSLVREAARAGRKRMMVVGHEPDVSILVAHLLGESLPSSFTKAMVVGLRIAANDSEAVLRFVLDPKTLEFLADARSGAV